MTRAGMTITDSVTFVTWACSQCGVLSGMPEEFQRERRRDHKNFQCLNGHGQIYPAKSKEDELAEELQKERARLASWREDYARLSERAEQEKRSHAATKGRLTKTLNRVENGVCPHCHRTFVDLQRHVARHAASTPADIHAINEREKSS